MSTARKKIGFLIGGQEQEEIISPIHEKINTQTQGENNMDGDILLTPWHTELQERIAIYEKAVADKRFEQMPKSERDDMIKELNLFIRIDTQLLMGYQSR